MDFFHDKVVLITGAARGIGFATAELVASRGAKVVITDILEARLKDSSNKLLTSGAEVLSVYGDVANPNDCTRAVKETLNKFGRLDILVNNAGTSIVAKFEECLPDVCRKLIDVNLMGSVYMTLAALDALKETKGQIVFVSSVSGIRAIPNGSMYSASKAALRSLAESLRVELKPCGVHVGVICPGFTTSDATKTVMRGDGTSRPINRAPHDTPHGVAIGIAKLIEKRQCESILTPLGKITGVLQRLSPLLLDHILANRELKN